MARTLVTNKQYQACVEAGACKAPCDCGEKFRGDERPVVCVDWSQAKAFSQWAGGRLPGEAEWEYAARSAGQDRKFPWGDEPASCDRTVISGCSVEATMPVCSKPSGNTEQGLCDMAGNAWEWVEDRYHGSYEGAPADGSAWDVPAGAFRVQRGGSWFSDGGHARSALRSSRDWAYRNCHVGFRPAMDHSR
jgi:formylglycine-generating enzyme required for sulfatase activity